MKRPIFILYLISVTIHEIAAQQNWAAVPCSKMRKVEAINRMWVDSLHNEIILYSLDGSKICNTKYKGLFAYNGSAFHDLDLGVSTHRSGESAAGDYVKGLITFGNRTLFGGGFLTVGSDTLQSKSLALWNGMEWDTFPKHVFRNDLNPYSGGGFYGFLKHNGKLWMYGGFDTIGNTITKNITAYNGHTFEAVPSMPLTNPTPITKMIVYKNKLIATGNFDDYPAMNYDRLAQFDGTSWSPVGNGVRGGASACHEMAVYKDTLYIAGAFPKAAGNAGNTIMKWDGNQMHDAGFGDFCGYGAVWSLVPYRNRLYAFGGFACAADQKTFGMAYYENGKWTVSQDSVDNLITSAVLYNDAIYIGGGFKSINGDTTIQKFAKLLCPDFDAASGCLSGIRESSGKLNLKIFPNPSKDKIQIEFDQNIDIEKITISNTLGQQLNKYTEPKPGLEIDVSGLPQGIYFLKAESKHRQGVLKVVKE